jgi:hypothetical protein
VRLHCALKARAVTALHLHASLQSACIAMVHVTPACGAAQHIVHTYQDMYMHIDLGEAHAQAAQDAPVDEFKKCRREAHLPASQGTP